MQKMFPSFVYNNYSADGTIKSVSKVFLKLFQLLEMQQKIDDLKKAYNTNKYLNVWLDWCLETTNSCMKYMT